METGIVTKIIDSFYKTGSDGHVSIVKTIDNKYGVGWGLAYTDNIHTSDYSVDIFDTESEAYKAFDALYAEELFWNK